MTAEATDATGAAPQGAVIVALQPGQRPRVLQEAARYASLLKALLIVAHVDVTRFVTYEDPDGLVHSSALDINLPDGAEAFEQVTAEAAEHLVDFTGEWTTEQLIGDPAMAIKKLAEQVDAQLIVIGTRNSGLGETIRQFFTGAVATRLALRQSRPILVVPQHKPIEDDQPIFPHD